MSSARRIAASRANGMKSRGPVTPAGKARSAANAPVLHGLASPERASQSIVLINENRGEFIAAHQALVAEHAPSTPTEEVLVHEMAVIQWRLTRARAMESALLDNQMGLMMDELAESYESVDEPTRAALAFTRLAEKSTALSLLLRYEARLKRQAERSICNLFAFRAAQQQEQQLLQQEKVNMQSEPSPNNEHHPEELLFNDHQLQLLPADSAPQHPAPPRPIAAAGGPGGRDLTVPAIPPAPSSPQVDRLPDALQTDSRPDPAGTPSPFPRAA